MAPMLHVMLRPNVSLKFEFVETYYCEKDEDWQPQVNRDLRTPIMLQLLSIFSISTTQSNEYRFEIMESLLIGLGKPVLKKAKFPK